MISESKAVRALFERTARSAELDAATGMYYYGARYYDPRLSIFISVDPLAEQFMGWTPYHYVHQNPNNLIDPTGMSADGWVEWTSNKGDKHMTYDSSVNTKDEAIKKGYANLDEVYKKCISQVVRECLN